MPRHLISDAHEWINEIPTVPIYYLAKPQPRKLPPSSGSRFKVMNMKPSPTSRTSDQANCRQQSPHHLLPPLPPIPSHPAPPPSPPHPDAPLPTANSVPPPPAPSSSPPFPSSSCSPSLSASPPSQEKHAPPAKTRIKYKRRPQT